MGLPHSMDIMKYPARYQFGQQGAPCNGASCCTDTCIQMIVDYYKEEHYELQAIRRYAQQDINVFDERPCTGLNYIEVLRTLDRLGVKHYEAKFGVDAAFVWDKVDIGPVIVGVHYGTYPDEKGKCSGNNAEIAGKTDCSFRGAHAVLVVDKRHHILRPIRDSHRDFYVRDPDHNSDSRPERPDYDRIRRHDLLNAMENIVPYTAFRSTYVIHPTKKKNLNRL